MILVSKNLYTNELEYIVNKYNNTYRSTDKIKPVDVKSSTYIDSSKEKMKKILNLKLMILLKYQNIKISLQKITVQVDMKTFL